MQKEAVIKEEKLEKERRRELKEKRRVRERRKEREREKEGDREKEKDNEVLCSGGERMLNFKQTYEHLSQRTRLPSGLLRPAWN